MSHESSDSDEFSPYKKWVICFLIEGGTHEHLFNSDKIKWYVQNYILILFHSSFYQMQILITKYPLNIEQQFDFGYISENRKSNEIKNFQVSSKILFF